MVSELVEVVAVLVSELVEVGVGVTEGALIVVKLLEEVKLEPAFDPLTVNWYVVPGISPVRLYATLY